MSDRELEEAARRAAQLRGETRAAVGRVVVGLEGVTDQLLMALLCGGHALLEGVPGTAKTTLCRSFARALDIHYQRIQFTPDLLPADVTGTQVLDRATSDFVLRQGPIFCQLLLADELNRAPARTQSALLEAMQERQVTIEGKTLPLPLPFLVLATQNPVEQEGVYRLPEAQLDRFLFRVMVGYPARQHEIAMLDLHSTAPAPPEQVTTIEEILHLQQQVDRVHLTAELKGYLVDVIRATRMDRDLVLGASPRAAISLMKAAKAHALLEGRGFVTHEDVQQMAAPVLAHRLIMQPEAEMDGRRVQDVLQRAIEATPVLSSGGG